MLISIVIPTYKRASTIGRAVESALSQTYQDLQIIVVDDNSEDNTSEVVSSYKDNRIIYVRNEKTLGPQAARNRGIDVGQGKLVAFLDSDDQFVDNKLQMQADLLKNSGERVGVVHCDCYQKIEISGEVKKFGVPNMRGDIHREILTRPGPMFPGMLVRKELLRQIGYLDESIVSFQEWDTAIRLGRVCDFEFIDEPLFVYNLHSQASISKDYLRGSKGYLQVVGKHMREIRELCGPRVLSGHYKLAAEWAYRGGDIDLTKKLFSMALRTRPFDPKLLARICVLNLNKGWYDRMVCLYAGIKDIQH